MFIVKRKYFIKAIAYLSVFFVVIAAILISDSKKSPQKNTVYPTDEYPIIINTCASLNAITTSFEKAFLTGDFSKESKEIYAQCQSTRSLLFYSAVQLNNTLNWFNDLGDYAKTDMSDDLKNDQYYSQLKEANSMLINVCASFKSGYSLNEIENHFDNNSPKSFQKNLWKPLEDSFPILEKQIVADKQEITNYAKDILDFPLTPKLFKGSFSLQKSVNYSQFNSYAQIFPSGKFLNRMAVASFTDDGEANNISADTAAVEHLLKHAPYAKNFVKAFTFENSGLLYYIFCPEITTETTKALNYNESIKLAIDQKNKELKAFDAKNYLKNHGAPPQPQPSFSSVPDLPSYITSAEPLSERNGLIEELSFTEYSFKDKNNNSFYYIYVYETKESRLFSEIEYLRFLKQI